MTWTIRVLNWKDFQHYKKREPPWIKLHRKLFAKTGWRRLHGSAAKLLVDLWMLAAGNEEGELSATLVDLAYDVRLPEADVLADLQVLAALGFVELASGALAPSKQSSPTPPLSRGETEAEIEAEKSKSGARAPILEQRNPMQMLGPLIREHLYRGTPPEGYDTRRCAHVCKTLLATGRYSADDLREAILMVPVVRAGKVSCDDSFRRFFLKHASVTMLVLNDRWGSGLVLDQLLHLAIKADARRPATIHIPGAA